MGYLSALLNQGWFGSLVGIVGILLAFVFYVRSKARSKLSYQSGGIRLIGQRGELPDEVTVTYRDIPVNMLSASTVAIWNAGKTTLEGSAIVGDDPLRLEFGPDAKILSTELIKITRPVIHFLVEAQHVHPGSVLLSFGFLDPGDGAVLRILHTGKVLRPAVHGTLKGMPLGCVDAGTMEDAQLLRKPKSRGDRYARWMVAVIFLASGVIFIASGVSPELWKLMNSWPEVTRPTADSVAWLPVIFGALLIVAVFIGIASLRRRYPKSLEIRPELTEGR
jgi:hypothetical protein